MVWSPDPYVRQARKYKKREKIRQIAEKGKKYETRHDRRKDGMKRTNPASGMRGIYE